MANFEQLELLEEVGRTSDIIEYIASVAVTRQLNYREMHSINMAFKNKVQSQLASIKIVREQASKSRTQKAIKKKYRQEIELDLKFYCIFFMRILERNFETFPPTDHLIVIIKNKLIGDYNRYLSEVESEFHQATTAAKTAYEKAINDAALHLHPCHPTRLGLAINYSLLYEDLKQPDIAYNIAERAFKIGIMEYRILRADRAYCELIHNALDRLEANMVRFAEKKSTVSSANWFIIFFLWVTYAIVKTL